MGQTNSFTRLINSRKHIRLYAREYAEEHGLNASEVEKDIIQAKKYNHISFGEYAWTGFYDLTQEQKKTDLHSGPVWNFVRNLQTDVISVC